MDRQSIEQVRSFNRTMTERIGVLNDHFLGRNHPLGEARLLWEIGKEGSKIRELRRRLQLNSVLCQPPAAFSGEARLGCDQN